MEKTTKQNSVKAVNSDKFWNIIDNADSFSKRTNSAEIEFGWAQQVNLAFAVELYLKAIIEVEKGEIARGHNLKTLFRLLDNKTKDAIFHYWRALSGTNIPDNKTIKKWFNDNIYACCKTFESFRYVHEWAGCRTSMETSWDAEQFNQLSIFSGNRPLGELQVYGSFLKEFENAIKQHIRENIIPKLPRPFNDIEIAFNVSSTITRPDGSTKTEHNKSVIGFNIMNDEE